MINHYTANKKVRNDDAYSPGGRIGLRPDRATLPYCQRAREAFPGVPVIAGGVEASLRRLAHYDYWSDTVTRSILLDCKADLRRLRHGRADASSRSPSGWRPGKTVQRSARHARRGLRARARSESRRSRDAESQRLGIECDRAPLLRGGARPTSSPSPRRRGIIHIEHEPVQRRDAGAVPRPRRPSSPTRRRCRSPKRRWTAIYDLPYTRRPHPTLHASRSPPTR